MSKAKLSQWDSAEYLKTPEDIIQYLAACLEEDDPQLIPHALGIVARSKGMTQLAKETGISREGLYKALSEQGNPEFATVMKVIKGLGLKLTLSAA